MAIWTAETILGLGLRLVISQPEPVSNIANPMLEREAAARMTTKEEWPNTPQRDSALNGVSGLTLSSLVK